MKYKFSLLFFGMFAFACRDKQPQLHIFDKAALATAVHRADTLSAENAYIIACSLPKGEVQDSFYAQLVENKGSDTPTNLRAHGDFYQKLRGGNVGAEILLANIYGTANFNDAKLPAAKICFENGLQLAETARDTSEIIEFLKQIANCDLNLGKFDEATKCTFRTLQFVETFGSDPLDIADLQVQLSECLHKNKEYDKAVAAATLAALAYQKAGDLESEALANFTIGAALEYKHDFENAVVHYNKAIEYNKKQGDYEGLTVIYGQVANLWLNYKDYPKAIIAVESAIFWNKKNPSRLFDGELECLLGDALFKNGNLIQGKKHLLAGLEYGKQHQKPEMEIYAAESLYLLHKAQNQLSEALRYHENLVAQRDTLNSNAKQKTISELNIKYETAEKEKQIVESENQRKIARLRTIAIVLLLLLALGFALGLFFRQRGRHRILQKEKYLLDTEKRLEAERNRLELDEKQLELEKAQRDIELEREQNIRQLKIFTEQLLEKNLQIEQMQADTKGDVEKDMEESFNKLYHSNILTQGDWEMFKQRFEQAYPGFQQQLGTQYPQITPNETRLLLLSKMGVTVASEIAAILGVSPDAVRKSRHRLRKKMGLTHTTISDLLPDI